MKRIIILFIALPTMLMSQNNVELTPTIKGEINQVVRNCLEKYKNESKVTTRNEDYFYNLFTDNETIIDDIIPSASFGNEINSMDWVELMKGIQLYNIDLEVLKWEEYSPYSLDSGYVIAKVKKTVLSSMWNDKVRKDFNIVVNDGSKEEITQKVRYNSEEIFEFKFIYCLNSDEIKCSIKSIKKINDLQNRKVYVPYSKAFIGKRQIMETVNFNDTGKFTSGDNIKYFIEDSNLKFDEYKINGYRKPKARKSDKNFIKNLVYQKKWSVGLTSPFFLLSNQSSVIDFGEKIIPSNIEYSESINASGSLDLYKLKNFSIAVKANYVNSNIDIGIDSYENISELSNPISNNENTYTRINTITNFSEILTVNQMMLSLTANYKFKPFTIFISSNLFSTNKINSNRSASSKYIGTFHQEFEIEIDEPINYIMNDGVENTLELGYKELNLEEEIEFIQKAASVWEFGAMYTIPYLKFLNLYFVYKLDTDSWFVNSSDQISKDFNEFNSFVSFSEKFQMNGRISLGLSLSLKL